MIADDKTHSHAMLYLAVQRQAAALAALGVKPGDRVLLVAGNRPEVLALLRVYTQPAYSSLALKWVRMS